MKKIIISSFMLLSTLAFTEEIREIQGNFEQERLIIDQSIDESKIFENSETHSTVEIENKTTIYYGNKPQVLRDIDNQITVANRNNIKGLIDRYDQELNKYLEAINYDSDRIFYLANEYFINNDYSKANKIFLKDNTDLKNIFGAATTHRFMGQNLQAIDKYSQAISMNSTFAESYLGRGLAYRNLDRYDEAVKDLDKYIKMTSSHDGYIALGDVYFKMGKNKEAYDIVSQGLAKYSNSSILKTLANNILRNKIN